MVMLRCDLSFEVGEEWFIILRYLQLGFGVLITDLLRFESPSEYFVGLLAARQRIRVICIHPS